MSNLDDLFREDHVQLASVNNDNGHVISRKSQRHSQVTNDNRIVEEINHSMSPKTHLHLLQTITLPLHMITIPKYRNKTFTTVLIWSTKVQTANNYVL